MDGITGMTARVSVVIPSKNEETRIAASVRSAQAAGAAEVVVADGESSDGTLHVAQEMGARVLVIGGHRAQRMNEGFAAATGDAVCFLHADTTLPPDACQAISSRIDAGAEFGGFLLAFAERDPRLAVAALMINMRTRITRAPWGDQAHFFSRDRFVRGGGYAEIPIMEDYEMALRMRKATRPVILPLRVTTSGRRFLQLGLLKTAVINWRIVIAWHRGASPDQLRRLYGAR